MVYTIVVKSNPNDASPIFQKELSADEFKTVKAFSKYNYWGFAAQFIPVRTDNWSDFFYPAVKQSAIKINLFCFTKNDPANVFFRFCEICADVVTFAFRFVTLFPRTIYNLLHPKEKNPLYLFLKTNGAPEALLKVNDVFVVLKSETPKRKEQSENWVCFTPQHASLDTTYRGKIWNGVGELGEKYAGSSFIK